MVNHILRSQDNLLLILQFLKDGTGLPVNLDITGDNLSNIASAVLIPITPNNPAVKTIEVKMQQHLQLLYLVYL